MNNFEITRSFPETDIIDEVYELRLDADPNFIMPKEMIEPATVRALVELRLYHLPTYYLIPSLTKSKLCSQSGPCFHLQSDFMQATRVERETFYDTSPLFANKTREHCKICGSTRATKDGVCYHCVAIQLNYTKTEERKLCKEYNAYSVLRSTNWTSPKRMLMAEELGCLKCGKKLPPSDDFWLGPEIEFQDGLCGECRFDTDHFWNVHPEPYHTPHKAIPYCLKCGNQGQYALWGMCDACYYDWQTTFYDRVRTAKSLLVSPTKEWRDYVLQNKKMKLLRPFKHIDIKAMVLQHQINRRIKT